MNKSYKSAGVNLEAGDKAVEKIKEYAEKTFTPNVLKGIGHFGAFFKLDLAGFKDPVLVSSVDGVGTKLKIAIELNKHDTIGQDLVNHCVNDIAVGGATPLYFLDYLAFGKLIPDVAAEIIKGFAEACKQNGLALIGGETAEMPGLYAEGEYDISGTIVGIVERSKIIDGSTIQKGDVLIGLESNGLHTNGYSLARKVLLNNYSLNDFIPELNSTLGEELLKVHLSYLPFIRAAVEKVNVKAFSHITGGGIVDNTKRVVPKNLVINIDWNSWEMLPIFRLIQEEGKISDEEMRRVFNLGIGLIAVVKSTDVKALLEIADNTKFNAHLIGEITEKGE